MKLVQRVSAEPELAMRDVKRDRHDAAHGRDTQTATDAVGDSAGNVSVGDPGDPDVGTAPICRVNRRTAPNSTAADDEVTATASSTTASAPGGTTGQANAATRRVYSVRLNSQIAIPSIPSPSAMITPTSSRPGRASPTR